MSEFIHRWSRRAGARWLAVPAVRALAVGLPKPTNLYLDLYPSKCILFLAFFLAYSFYNKVCSKVLLNRLTFLVPWFFFYTFKKLWRRKKGFFTFFVIVRIPVSVTLLKGWQPYLCVSWWRWNSGFRLVFNIESKENISYQIIGCG